jgi:16S rRNA processing protein RimM
MSRVVLAQIVGVQGLKGEVRLKSFAADPSGLMGYGALIADNGRGLTITALRPLKGVFAARIEGVTDRNAAQALVGQRLSIQRSALPPPDDDEFYFADLIGLAAVDTAGAELGKVIAVHNFGAGDLLEVDLDAESRTVFVPFTRSVVPRVDFAAGRLVIDPPPGLMDDLSNEMPPRAGSE